MNTHSARFVSACAQMICPAFFGQHRKRDHLKRSGRVIHGNKLGRQLGIPTANIALPDEAQLRYGVLCRAGRIRRSCRGRGGLLGNAPTFRRWRAAA
ncbi:riboflavin kinase [Paracoccus sp. (in: a-proteobacteria)]|uniref:riboflavin kinase n=1 Tax=Paracoccus sp. TaxID=267 RepID=UPI0034CDBEFD